MPHMNIVFMGFISLSLAGILASIPQAPRVKVDDIWCLDVRKYSVTNSEASGAAFGNAPLSRYKKRS